jgi:hypothetical protein
MPTADTTRKWKRGMRFVHSATPIEPGDLRILESEAAMSFREIGEEMGISGSGAHVLYRQAMKKMRANPLMIALLVDQFCFNRRKQVQSVTAEYGIQPKRLQTSFLAETRRTMRSAGFSGR